MSKKVIYPLIAVFTVGMAAGSLGCQASASAHVGDTTPKAAEPPPPPPPAPPPPPPEPPPPPPKPIRPLGKAKIEKDEIKIPGKIHFDTDKATLKDDKETKEIIQTVADVMKENKQITKLRVEGHTDDTGGSPHNIKLSQERADSVVAALVKLGTEKERLDPKGWGQDRNIEKNDNAAHKEANRRVEFRLWEIDSKPTDAQKNDAPPPGSAAALAAAGGGDKKDATGAAAKAADPKAAAGAAKDDKKGATPAAATPATPAKK
jgi:outer membrane protein OmpA-like peptidoglycan-associated protein